MQDAIRGRGPRPAERELQRAVVIVTFYMLLRCMSIVIRFLDILISSQNLCHSDTLLWAQPADWVSKREGKRN